MTGSLSCSFLPFSMLDKNGKTNLIFQQNILPASIFLLSLSIHRFKLLIAFKLNARSASSMHVKSKELQTILSKWQNKRLKFLAVFTNVQRHFDPLGGLSKLKWGGFHNIMTKIEGKLDRLLWSHVQKCLLLFTPFGNYWRGDIALGIYKKLSFFVPQFEGSDFPVCLEKDGQKLETIKIAWLIGWHGNSSATS